MRFGNAQKASQTLTPDDEEYNDKWKMFEGPLNDDLHGLQEQELLQAQKDMDALMATPENPNYI